jgi:competence protein ComEA
MLLLLAALLPAVAGALEVNVATRAQLEQLEGLGVATTERILEQRARRPFEDWHDLVRRVSGLRGRRAEALDRQGLKVNGKPLRAADVEKGK